MCIIAKLFHWNPEMWYWANWV